jgi:cell division septal protein FtsQ
MSPKPNRRPLTIEAILLVVLILIVASGVMYSPMTSIVRVNVIGAEQFDRRHISAILAALQDVPYARLSPRLVESAVLETPEVHDAVFSRNIFGRAQLSVTYRKPVAKLVGDDLLCLSDEGVVYPDHQVAPGLPLVQAPDSLRNPALTFAVEPPLVALSQVCAQLPSQVDKSQTVVLYNPDRGLCLNVGNGSSTVVFGSADRLDEKLQKLSGLLQQSPDLFRQCLTVNLMAPENPAVVYRSAAKSLN